jgi:anti-anti-sigma factor
MKSGASDGCSQQLAPIDNDEVAGDADPRRTGPSVTYSHPAEGVLLIVACGELDSAGAGQVRTLCDQLLEASSCRRVIVNLTGVHMVSRAGVELLMELHRRSRSVGFVLILVGSSCPSVERPLQQAGVLPLFVTRPTVNYALSNC